MRTLLEGGDPALHESVQAHWPLDAEAAFGVLPTPLRLHADPRFAGRGVTLAMVDAGFFPHPDLTQPTNRIRAWVDATHDPVVALRFGPDDAPAWPDWDGRRPWQWHGVMTSTVAAGNGFLSHGLYRGLAHEAEVVLVQVRDAGGHIGNDGIARAFRWLLEQGPSLGVRVVSSSVSGDPVAPSSGNPVDEAVAALVAAGVVVVAAAGNDGVRRLVPPATAPLAVTVGGLDDKNALDHAALELWHGNYGAAADGAAKPELVAPSIWVVAPVLPGTAVAAEAADLFRRRTAGDRGRDARIAELKLVTPHYQHVDGTSFAAPVVASTVACMLEASPSLDAHAVRDILVRTAYLVPGAPAERQGAGALHAGQAVSRALSAPTGSGALQPSPTVTASSVTFTLRDPAAREVRVLGSWDGWAPPGLAAKAVGPGSWSTDALPLARGRHAYKFVLDGERWLADPANPRRAHDGQGGFNSVVEVG